MITREPLARSAQTICPRAAFIGRLGTVVGSVLLLVVAGCGPAPANQRSTTGAAGQEATTEASADRSSGMSMGGHAESEYTFGEPADASAATREVAISAADSLRFDPETVAVKAGEVITFKVTNSGAIAHDFTLGDGATQMEHATAMAASAGMSHDEPNAFTVAPGETKSLTWRFGEPGEVFFGCHTPGHYEAGMKGTVTVH
jgi:uncharacterized cupredoxin-like copper-binding protein